MERILKQLLYYSGLAFIAIFLFCTHAKQLNAMDAWNQTELFNFEFFDFRKYLHYIYAASFAVTPVVIIALIEKKDKYFWTFAIIIGISEFTVVQLFNNTEIIENWWRIISSWYYSFYALIVIVMYAYIGTTAKLRNKPVKVLQKRAIATQIPQMKHIDEAKVMKLLRKMKPSDVAREMNIRPDQVTRIKQKNSK